MSKVVLFRVGSPAGFVNHATPRLLRQHLAISSGPLLVNSTLAFLLLIQAAHMYATRPGPWWPLPAVLALWLGWSVALEAWPSAGDAGALSRSAAAALRQLNPSALPALLLAWALLAVHASRRLWGHWLYAGLLAAQAWRLANT